MHRVPCSSLGVFQQNPAGTTIPARRSRPYGAGQADSGLGPGTAQAAPEAIATRSRLEVLTLETVGASADHAYLLMAGASSASMTLQHEEKPRGK
jgi:hypothetical protein